MSGEILADEPDEDRKSQHTSPAALSTGHPKMVLGVRWQSPACAEQVQKRARDALTLATCVGDFDCRLSAELLGGLWPAPLVADGPFEDVLLNIPVKGQAHVEAKLSMLPVADAHRAAVDVVVAGISQMQGVARSHRVQIDCDATAEFRAVKRMYLDADGVTGLPATCTAKSTFTTKGITTRQPKLLAKFSERIAQQILVDQQEEAQEECSEHVAEALCAAVDREMGSLMTAINAAFEDFRSSTAETHLNRWQQVRFQSDDGALRITSVADENKSWVSDQTGLEKASAPLALRVARTGLDVQRLLLAAPALFTAEQPVAGGTASLAGRLTPSVSWQKQSLTVLLNYVPAARLAAEPVLAAPKQ